MEQLHDTKEFEKSNSSATMIALCTVTLQPREARSQVQLLAPAACATGVGCVAVGIVFFGSIAYMVWQSQDTGKMHYDVMEDPEDHELWGKYRARDADHCRWLAAGRDHYWDWKTGKCHIKG